MNHFYLVLYTKIDPRRTLTIFFDNAKNREQMIRPNFLIPAGYFRLVKELYLEANVETIAGMIRM